MSEYCLQSTIRDVHICDRLVEFRLVDTAEGELAVGVRAVGWGLEGDTDFVFAE